jgi:hypothetical protein
MIQAETVAFTGALVWKFPELLPDLGEHLADNDREVPPPRLHGADRAMG